MDSGALESPGPPGGLPGLRTLSAGTSDAKNPGPAARLCLALLLLAPAFPSLPTAGAQPAVLIRNTLLIDGSGGEPGPRADILLENGRISRLGPAGSFPVPSGVAVVDGRGKVATPGIITLRGLAGLIRSPVDSGEHFERGTIVRHLNRYASYGVTTVATLAPDEGTLLRLRDEIEQGKTASLSRVVTPLRALSTPALPNEHPQPLVPALAAVRRPAAARRLIDRLATDGADFVEILTTDDVDWQRQGPRLVRRVVRSAERHGLRLLASTSSTKVADSLVRAGVHVLVGSLCDAEVTDDLVARMASAGTVYAPGLLAAQLRFEYGDPPEWLSDRYLRRSLPAGIAGMLRGPVMMRQALDPDRSLKRARFDVARRNLKRLAEGGVRIALAGGSGVPGTFEGYSEYQEAVLMRRAGLSSLAVIQAFSEGSATALGLAHDRGALRPGQRADMILLNASPLENIHHLRELHAVFVGGRLVKL